MSKQYEDPRSLEIRLEQLWTEDADLASIFGLPQPNETPPPESSLSKINEINKRRRSTLGTKPRVASTSRERGSFNPLPWWFAGALGTLAFSLALLIVAELPPKPDEAQKSFFLYALLGWPVAIGLLATGARHDWHWRPAYNRWLRFRKGRRERALEYQRESVRLRVDVHDPELQAESHGLSLADEETQP